MGENTKDMESKTKCSFNISSTIINEDFRVSTAAVFYSEWFGDRYQLETIVFSTVKGGFRMKIHDVPSNDKGIEYCKRFHEKTVAMVKSKIN